MLLIAFTPFPAPSGAATRVAQRVLSFSDAGYAIELLTPKTGRLPYVSQLANARILRVPMPQVRDGQLDEIRLADRLAAFERAVRRQLTVNEYDVIHTFDAFTGLVVTAQRGLARLVFEPGGGVLDADGDESLASELRHRERELFRTADVVLVPTADVGLRARGLGAAQNAIHVIRPSTAPDLFRPPPDRRRRVSVAVEVTLTATSLEQTEVTLLTDALDRLPASLELSVTVSAELSPDDERRLSLHPRARVVEPVLYEDLVALYQRGDIGLVLSAGVVRGELPAVRLQVIAEMMASGLPVVAPDVPAVREIVGHGQEGLLVPPGGAPQLAQALEQLGESATHRRTMGMRARQRAVLELDERHVASRLLALYGTTIAPSVSVSPTAFFDISVPSQRLDDVQSLFTLSRRFDGDGAMPLTQPVAMAQLLKQLPRARPRRVVRPSEDVTQLSFVDDGPTDPVRALPRARTATGLTATGSTQTEIWPIVVR